MSHRKLLEENGDYVIDDTSSPRHATVDAIPVTVVDDAGTEGIDLFALGVSFLAQWRLAVGTTLVVAALCVTYVLRLKPQYVAVATILPQEGRSSDTLASLFSSHGPGGLYVGLLRSRGLQDIVVQRADLLRVYHVTDPEAARGILTGTSTFADTPDGLMTVSVRDGDAAEAAIIANTYLDALNELNNSMSEQQTRRTVAFFQGQLKQERDDLSKAEDEYQVLQRQTGQLDPGSQTASALSTIQGTQQRIKDLQVQRSQKLQSETPENPEIRALDAQISTLQGQESVEESASGAPRLGAAPSASRALDQNLNLQRASRDVAYYTALVNSLGNDFEQARMNDIAGRSAFQVVDRAIPPENKAWPPRKPYFGISLAFAVLTGLLAVVFKLLVLRVMAHAATRGRLQTLRGAFR